MEGYYIPSAQLPGWNICTCFFFKHVATLQAQALCPKCNYCVLVMCEQHLSCTMKHLLPIYWLCGGILLLACSIGRSSKALQTAALCPVWPLTSCWIEIKTYKIPGSIWDSLKSFSLFQVFFDPQHSHQKNNLDCISLVLLEFADLVVHLMGCIHPTKCKGIHSFWPYRCIV